MTNNPISEFTELTQPRSGDQFAIVDPSELLAEDQTKRIDWDRIVAIYNVRNYGAVGDGVTDNLVSIQAAVDACAAAGGGVVYCPAGTYVIGSGYISLGSNVQLIGDGLGVTTLQKGAAATDELIRILDAGGIESVRCMTLDLNKANTVDGGSDFS